MPKKQSFVAWFRRFISSDNDGGALVEMAITLPIMMLIMTGIFSFSVALYQKEQLAEAVGNAGRQLAVDRGAVDPCLDAANAVYAAAPGLNSSKITLSITMGGTTTGGTCTNKGGANNSLMPAGGNAQLQASYPCILQVFGYANASSSCTLYSQVTEVIQ